MSFDLAAIERAVLSAPPSVVADFPISMEAVATDVVDGVVEYEDDFVLMSFETWHNQYELIHATIGGVVESRIKNTYGVTVDVPLNETVNTHAGKKTSRIIYDKLLKIKFLRRQLLNDNDGIMGTLMVFGMHGQNCVSIVKTAYKEADRLSPLTDNDAPEFVSQRKAEEERP